MVKQLLHCRKCNKHGRENFTFPDAIHHTCKECGTINGLGDRVTIDEKTGEVVKRWKKQYM